MNQQAIMNQIINYLIDKYDQYANDPASYTENASYDGCYVNDLATSYLKELFGANTINNMQACLKADLNLGLDDEAEVINSTMDLKHASAQTKAMWAKDYWTNVKDYLANQIILGQVNQTLWALDQAEFH